MPLLKLPYFDGRARTDMKTVGEGDLLTACTGGGGRGVVVGFLFLAPALSKPVWKESKKK